MNGYATEMAVVYTPTVYTPPPPPAPAPPTPTVTMSRCGLCGALVGMGVQGQHTDWHRANGLHGWSCAALKSLRARIDSGDPAHELDACDCGLEPTKRENDR